MGLCQLYFYAGLHELHQSHFTSSNRYKYTSNMGFHIERLIESHMNKRRENAENAAGYIARTGSDRHRGTVHISEVGNLKI